MTDKPTFLLLRSRLPADYAPTLLGRFVADPLRPTDNSTPKHPQTLIGSQVVRIEEKSAQAQIKAVSSVAAQGQLKDLLQAQAGRKSETEHEIQSATVVTMYRLKDQYEAFDTLKVHKDVKPKLHDLFQRQNGLLYMVVGVKTCTDGTTMVSKRSYEGSLLAGLTLPLSQAFQVPVANPQVTLSSTDQATTTQASEAAEEQVFAVEYRRVRQRVMGIYASKASVKVDTEIMEQRWDNAVFSESQRADGAVLSDEENARLAQEDDAVLSYCSDDEESVTIDLVLDIGSFLPPLLDGELPIVI